MLIALDIPVDPPHKQIGPEKSNSSTENSQTETEHESVSKVEAGLEEPSHFCLHVIVIYRIQVYINCC